MGPKVGQMPQRCKGNNSAGVYLSQMSKTISQSPAMTGGPMPDPGSVHKNTLQYSLASRQINILLEYITGITANGLKIRPVIASSNQLALFTFVPF